MRACSSDALDAGRGDRRRPRSWCTTTRPPATAGSCSGRAAAACAYNAKIGDDFNHAPRRSAWVTEHMHKILPATVGAEITHSWAGPVARTDDGLPIFGHLADNVVHGGGYSGNGVGPSWVGGRILASLALGAKRRVVERRPCARPRPGVPA